MPEKTLAETVAEQTAALNEARDSFDNAVPELRHKATRNLIVGVAGIVLLVLAAVGVGLGIWALADSQSAGSKADANQAVARAARLSNIATCRVGNEFRADTKKEFQFIINAFTASAQQTALGQSELKAFQNLVDTTNAPRNCLALYPLPKHK
jgi:hypothetical protein